MTKIFGDFNTYEEINEAAKGLLDEGDTKNIYVLAKENGIDKEVAKLFAEKELDFLCDAESAAIGKIDMEAAELKCEEIMADWAEYIKGCIMKNEKMAAAVMKKDKTLKGCIAQLLVWSFKNAKDVDKEIISAAGIKASGCKLGIPGMGRAKKIIQEYYSK